METTKRTGWGGLLDSALEYANDAVAILDCPDGVPTAIQYVNAAFERQTGYMREELLGKPPSMLHGEQTDKAVVDELIRSIQSLQPTLGDIRKYRKDGTPFWAELNIQPVADESGRLSAAIIVQRDVTEERESKWELELLSTALNQANDGISIFRWDPAAHAWRIRHVNEMFLTLTGYELHELIGNTTDMLVGPLTDEPGLRAFREALLAGKTVRREFAFRRKDGSHVWLELSARGTISTLDEITHTTVVYRDVTERHREKEQLAFEATHDPLTGIFNRRFFGKAIDDALRDARERNLAHGLLFFDLDGFKPVNDTFGHDAGDRLLIELVRALLAHLRTGDIFARIGGDEFAVLLLGCPLPRARQIAAELLDAIRAVEIPWHEGRLCVGASIGVVALDATSGDAAEALRRADEACYAAKHAGRDRIVVA